MSTPTAINTPPHNWKPLSHLFRLFAEHNVTVESLNQLFGTGILTKVLDADPTKVSIPALERVLGLAPALEEMRMPFKVDYSKTIDQIRKEHGILAADDRHSDPTFHQSNCSAELTAVFTQVARPSWGRVERSERARGVRPADLRELLYFIIQYDAAKNGELVLYARGTRLGGKDPEIFYVGKHTNGDMSLMHESSYHGFNPKAKFLSILPEG